MLAKQFRIQKTRDFNRIYKYGKSINSAFFSVRFTNNKLNHSRFAVVVSKKTSLLAVKRNKLKRQTTDILQKIIRKYNESFDIILLARKKILNASYQEIEQDINYIIKKI